MAIEEFKKLVDEYYCAVADYWDPRTADRRDWPHRRDAAKALYEYVEKLERERDEANAKCERLLRGARSRAWTSTCARCRR